MLLVPVATGASVGLLAGGSAWPLLPFCIAALAVFSLRTPLETWIGTTPVRARTDAELRLVRNAVFTLAAVSLAALIWLFRGGRNPDLWWIGSVAAVAFAARALVKQAWRRGRLAAQMAGAAGLTFAAPAAYSAVTGHLDPAAWSLWIANLLFAVNQIHYVQLRIHAARAMKPHEKLAAGRGFLIGQGILMMLLVAACAGHLLRWQAGMAFVPVLCRGFAWFGARGKPLAIHALGLSELIHACAFGVLLVWGIG